MTNHVCPFVGQKEETFYCGGNIKSVTYHPPIGNLATVGIPMAATAAAVNGLIAYLSGNSPLAASALGGLFAFEFCLIDFAGHQLKGEEYHKQLLQVVVRNVIQLAINFRVCFTATQEHALGFSTFTKAWAVLLPFAICQSAESFYFHKES